IGLKVRSSMPKYGYLALGATTGGKDASLTPWQPTPEWGQEIYEARLKMIGGITGIGFLTNDLKGTVADLKKKGVKAEIEREDGTFGRFTDPDGNVLFLAQPDKPKVRRKGVSALTFVTVVSKDSKKTGEFFKKALGLKSHRVPGEEGFTDYRSSEKGADRSVRLPGLPRVPSGGAPCPTGPRRSAEEGSDALRSRADGPAPDPSSGRRGASKSGGRRGSRGGRRSLRGSRYT